jgi:hypothetical protein
MQRRIQKAYLVFGEEGVCSRLHGVLAGEAAGMQQAVGDAGGEYKRPEHNEAISQNVVSV